LPQNGPSPVVRRLFDGNDGDNDNDNDNKVKQNIAHSVHKKSQPGKFTHLSICKLTSYLRKHMWTEKLFKPFTNLSILQTGPLYLQTGTF